MQFELPQLGFRIAVPLMIRICSYNSVKMVEVGSKHLLFLMCARSLSRLGFCC